MTNQEYFIDDCKSCKYAVGADGCFALYSDAAVKPDEVRTEAGNIEDLDRGTFEW